MLKKILTITAIILAVFSNVGLAANVSDEPIKNFVQKYNAIAKEFQILELNTEIELLMEDSGYKFYATYSAPEISTVMVFVTQDDNNFERLIISSPDPEKSSMAMICALFTLGFSEDEFKQLEAEVEKNESTLSIYCAAANRNFILKRTTDEGAYEVEISAG